MINYLFGNNGFKLYEAIASSNVNEVCSITSSKSRPPFADIRKEGAEQNLFIVARYNPQIIMPLLNAYADKFPNAKKLLKVLKTLMDAKIPYEGNVQLYEKFINFFIKKGESYSAYYFIEELNALKDAHEEDIVPLYQALIDNTFYAKKLGEGFVELINAQIFYKDNIELYQALIKAPDYADKLGLGFAVLKDAQIPYKNNIKLYQELIKAADYGYANELISVFIALKNAQIPGNAKLYQKLIKKGFYARQLAQGIGELINAKIPYKDNTELYQALIKKLNCADKLAQGFVALIDAQIPYKDNFELYQALILNADSADKRALAFVALKDAQIPYEGNIQLYETVINASTTDKLSKGFATLKGTIPYEGNAKLFQSLMNKIDCANKLALGFAALKEAKFPYADHVQLYEALINEAYSADQLIQGFIALENAKIPYKGNAQLCLSLIQNVYCLSNLSPVFTALTDAHIAYAQNPSLYQEIIDNIGDAKKLPDVLDALKRTGMNYQQHAQLFTKHLLITNNTLTIHVLNALNQAGYSYQEHKNLLDAILNRLSKQISDQMILNMVKQLSDFAKTNPLLPSNAPDFAAQLKALEAIINSNSSPFDCLTQGPLNKSEATIKIEELLNQITKVDSDEKITKADIDSIMLSFNEHEHYILKLPDQDEVNLSLLIKNANLSQLTLSDMVISKIDNILRSLMGDWFDSTKISNNPITKLLPQIQQFAIAVFITSYYININKLFRSEEITGHKFCSIDNHNRLVCFLLGCLLNDAANKINWLPDQSREKVLLEKIAHHHQINMVDYVNNSSELNNFLERSFKAGVISEQEFNYAKTIDKPAFYPKSSTLDRGERLSEETIKGRLANPWTLPSLTSFSAFKEGSIYFHSKGTTRTKVEDDVKRYIIHFAEGEVILPQGEQVVTTQGPEGLVSTIKRSPTLEPKNHYWSDLALMNAFANYLSKEYKDVKNAITLNGRRILRPNHNLPHTYRVMEATEYVADYFAQFAKDAEFREFCQSLTDSDREWLRVAAAFSITGRESEKSAGEDLRRYDQYRQACAEHFNSFVDKTLENPEQKMQERMSHIVRYMGNPNYEGNDSQAGINNHSDEKERKIRNFYHRILTIAHKIDLPRCYSSKAFNLALKPCVDFSLQSETQKNALDDIIRYNIQLIKAHGGQLTCDIQQDGNIINVAFGYKDIFAEASSSMKRLFEITQTVTRPLLTKGVEQQHDAVLATSDVFLPSKAPNRKRRHDEAFNESANDYGSFFNDDHVRRSKRLRREKH